MAAVNLLDFVGANDSRSLEERFDAYRAAKRDAEVERREKFAVFGIPPGVTCPAAMMLHRESRYSPLTDLPLSAKESAALVRALDYKRYPDAHSISLPSNVPALDVSLEDAMRQRRSRKKFSDASLSLEIVSKLLALGSGVTQPGDIPRRAAPSAGALYPIEMYTLAFAVDNAQSGLYHYAPLVHSLEYVKPLNGLRDLRATLDYSFEDATPAAAFVMTARLPRAQAKYGERGYRFALMECGHIAQNMLLTATALGLNALPVGGFFDDGLNFLLGVDGEQEAAVYLVLVGKPGICKGE